MVKQVMSSVDAATLQFVAFVMNEQAFQAEGLRDAAALEVLKMSLCEAHATFFFFPAHLNRPFFCVRAESFASG